MVAKARRPIQTGGRMPAMQACMRGGQPPVRRAARAARPRPYSTVTDFARFLGLSTSVPRASAAW
jgi:hypothetical protein